MKRTLVVLACIFTLGLSFNAKAQTYAEKKKQFAAKMTQQLKDSVGLNEEQIKKVDEITIKFQPEFSAVAQDASLDAECKKKRYFEVYQQKRGELKQVISPQQINKMEAIEKRTKKEIGL